MQQNQLSPIDTVWDAVIIGAGPSGAATAITLADLGHKVLLVEERVTGRYKFGESLPPSSIDLVKHFLGDIESQNHRIGLYKTGGNVSIWASSEPDFKDFFFTGAGFGLCIDRLAFDEALRIRAQAVGATLIKGSTFHSCVRVDEPSLHWQVELSSDEGVKQYHARYLVDCSGRRAVVAKSIGVSMQESGDQLFAFAQWFSSEGADEDRFTRIEASPDGWWYTNRLPDTQTGGSKRLVVLHTDKDIAAAKTAATTEGFTQLLQSSPHILSILKDGKYKASSTIRGAPAHSQRLHYFCGEGWMAVGDAAQAYDPLSSQGIDKALRTASHAGYLIHYALTDSTGASPADTDSTYTPQYAIQQETIWQEYLAQRDFYYGSQPRWSDHPFWQRRQ